MFIKIHRAYRNVVALCDSEIIGKKFEEGKFQLDLRENFYKGEELSKEEIIKILKDQTLEDSTFNIVGKEATNVALESGIISEKMIGEIAGIPYSIKII